MYEEIESYLDQEDQQWPFFMEMAGISYCDGSYFIERKNSSVYTLEYIMEGKGTIETPVGRFYPKKGDLYFLHRKDNQRYYSDDEEPWQKIWINFRGPLADSLCQVYGLEEVYLFQGVDVYAYFTEILEYMRGEEKDIETRMHHLSLIFHRLMQELYRSRRTEKKIPENVRKVKYYLDEHLEEKVHLSDLEKLTFLSGSQIIRLFRKHYDITPYEYMLRRRIEMAKLLLCNTFMSVQQIAVKTGFGDEHYFSNFFKERTGYSPTGYRKVFGEVG